MSTLLTALIVSVVIITIGMICAVGIVYVLFRIGDKKHGK